MRAGASLALFFVFSAPVLSDEPEYDAAGIPSPSIATSLPANGDPGGYRKRLADHGVKFNWLYTNDVLANVRGGRRRGVIDQGKLEGSLSIDLEKLAGLGGLSFYGNFFQIHNTGRIRRDYVGGINTIAAIEGVPTTRLSELWLEQSFLDGKASLRFGQLVADTDFFFAGVSGLFLQSDWATILAANMPSGGPAYPLATPGIRLKVEPTNNLALLLAMYNGDPAGPGPGDEQIRNRYGLNFRFRDPPLVMAEAQHRTNQDENDTGLARAIKIGAWKHFGRYDDLRFANDATLLADPAGSGDPLRRRGNFGVYGTIVQQIYRPAGGDGTSGVSLFGRVSVSPSDRSPVNFFIDGGVVFSGIIPNRSADSFGASVLYAKFSNRLRAFERDQITFSGIPGVVQDSELNIELTYNAQVIPGWSVQPVLTYVRHPNGGGVRNALVTGVRSVWRF